MNFAAVLCCYLAHHDKLPSLTSDLLILLQQALFMLLWMDMPPHRELTPVRKAEEVELVLQLSCGQLWPPHHNCHRRFCLQHQSFLISLYCEKKSDIFNQ